MIFGILFYGVCFAVPDLGIPTTTNITIERMMSPVSKEAQQEKIVIEYIMDSITDYVVEHDWENYVAAKENRADEIGDIIEIYEYTIDDYGVYISSYKYRETKEIHYWRVEVIIDFNIDSGFFIQQSWMIELKGKQNVRSPKVFKKSPI
jgi:hypothetical protein